jgi:hypothetical protein
VSNTESGIPIGKLIDTRHEFSALIKANLYDYTGGNKSEGRAALLARQALDKFILDTPPISGDAEALRETYINATTLETLGELCDLLDTYYAKSNSRAKAAMACLVADKDALFRFLPPQQRTIEKIANGLEWLADRRFKELHESIRRSGIPYMK